MASLIPRWLEWAREIQALAQTGRHYAENPYQVERNERLLEIAGEIVSEHADLPLEPVQKIYKSLPGYATPRIDVRGAVFREGKLLLVRERSDEAWTMPGGWADVGDVPSQAAEREVWEEAGFEVKAKRVIGVYDANRSGPVELFHAFKVIFLCDLIGGQARSSYETLDAAFFGPDEIPQPLSQERTHPRHIQAAFSAYFDPLFPTEFD